MIPLCRPYIEDAEKNLVCKVLESGVLSLGPYLDKFEKHLAAKVGLPHGIAVTNGTSALEIILRALDISEGDEVITSPFSFIASANVVLLRGARPVFVDVEEDTLNMDPAQIEAKITPRTRAILAVHIFGHPCDMDKITAIAKKHDLILIEDACEALGSKWQGQPVGTFGKAAAFAFYANKQITTAEGGMIVTACDEIDRFARRFRNQGRNPDSTWLEHDEIGGNYRLSELHCALGVAQLERLDTLTRRRQTIVDMYQSRLAGHPDLTLPTARKQGAISWFLYVVRIKGGKDRRNSVMQRLAEEGIQSRAYFPAIHLQKPYREQFGCKAGDFPVTEAGADSVLALPFFPQLQESQIDEVSEKLRAALNQSSDIIQQ